MPRARIAMGLAATSALAWVLLIFGGPSTLSLPDLCTGRLIASVPTGAELMYALSWVSPGALVASWTLMIAAMMLPLLEGQIRHIRARSFGCDRAAVTLAFLAGYFCVWVVTGVAIVGISLFGRVALGASELPALVALTLAFAWQTTPWKQLALNRCHGRPPLATFGPGPLIAGGGYGIWQGTWCVASCLPIMAAALLADDHGEAAMVVAAIWIWAERVEQPQVASWRFIFPSRATRALRHRFLRHFQTSEAR